MQHDGNVLFCKIFSIIGNLVLCVRNASVVPSLTELTLYDSSWTTSFSRVSTLGVKM